MKILHIGDIHLGCTLDNQRRHHEFEKIFRFLTGLVQQEHIEAALFAGDVFDSGTPSVDSQTLYYDFLLDLQAAGCRQIIAIAGNHDNANLLEAPQGLLQRMNIHVIGRIDPDDPAQEVIALGPADDPAAFVCAVPFLRERDVRGPVPEGEDAQTKSSKLSAGIIRHYEDVYNLADRQRAGRDHIPIIAMGHFYAAGSTFAVGTEADGSPVPYETVGTLDALELGKMPGGFAYGALGHIHKPQTVRDHENWRYAGSLLKMQLRKNMYAPQVILLDTQDLSNPKGIEIPDACFHKMRVIEGDMAELRSQLNALISEKEPVWVKPVYTGEEVRVNWQIDLRLEMRNTNVQIIHPEVQRRKTGKETAAPEASDRTLSEMTPEKVFLETLDADPELKSGEQKKQLIEVYRTIQAKVLDPAACEERKTLAVPRGAMRFKKLIFKNVNSLYGEHVIDFEDRSFRNGIFLISGDTGAGKSSILDAVCLALYGCTPRTKPPNKDRDDIMSEGEKELSSELIFSLGEEEYRAWFSHRRTSRSDAQKPFADSEQKLYRQNREIAGSKETFKNEISKLLGLTLAQFTQCVLLAQGSFDAFLKAKPDDRSGILSNITGTEIYGKIGDAINQEYLQVKEDFNAQKKSNGNISLLPDEKRTELLQALADAQRRRQDLEKALREREGWQRIFCDIAQGESGLNEAAGLRDALLRQKTDSEPERLRLDDARRAAECQNDFLVCRQARKVLQDAETELSGLTGKNEALHGSVLEAREEQSAAEENLKKLLTEKTEKEALFRDVRSLDMQCREKDLLRGQEAKDLESARSAQARHLRDFQTAEKKWRILERNSEAAQRYLAEHAADGGLETRAALWEERRKNLVKAENENAERQKEADARQRELDRKCGELAPLREQELQAEKAEADHRQTLKNAGARIEELLDGHTEEEIRRQLIQTIQSQEFYKRALSYEEARKMLKPGERCPLCGGLDHDFCREGGLREIVYEQDIRCLQDTISELERQKKILSDGHAEGAKRTAKRMECTHRRENLESEIARQRNDLEQLKKRLAGELLETEKAAKALSGELSAALQTDWTDHSALPPELQKRISAFSSAREKAGQREEGRQEYENARQVFAQFESVDAAAVQEHQSLCTALDSEFDALTKQRRAKFEGDPDEAEKILDARIDQARKKLESAKNKATLAAAAEENNRKNQESLIRRLQDQLKPALEQVEKRFRDRLTVKNFADEADFLKKRMPSEEMSSLESKLLALDTSLTGAEATLKERIKNLEDMKKKLPENIREDEVDAELQKLREEEAEAGKVVRDFLLDIGKDDENRRLFAEAQQTAEKIRDRLTLLEYLDKHFGTARGARFTRIAQGYTFRHLITLANRNRLGLLRRHFTLVGDRDDPLELNVIDHYRGDVVRTSRNLSGGESFEVSLALALGLSEMSSISQKASLGNVLLDEGFGTLDDKALDSALELLMTLRSASGKLVGIISHVEKLKDRIETRIDVTSSGGMGMLSGAGVSSVSRPAPSSSRPGSRKAKRGRPGKSAASTASAEEFSLEPDML